MPLFGSRKSNPPDPPPTTWTPSIDTALCRGILRDLIDVAYSKGTSWSQRVEGVLNHLLRASDVPSDSMELIAMGRTSPQGIQSVMERPWYWIAANSRRALASADFETPAIAGYWLYSWKDLMEPKWGPYERNLWHISMFIPDAVMSDVRDAAVAACAQLPEDYVFFGDDEGTITAGVLRTLLPITLK